VILHIADRILHYQIPGAFVFRDFIAVVQVGGGAIVIVTDDRQLKAEITMLDLESSRRSGEL
jgi:hypothetical protein